LLGEGLCSTPPTERWASTAQSSIREYILGFLGVHSC
jgi:hypothetical protein